MKNIVFALAAFVSFGVNAQQSLTFKPTAKPNKTYSTEIVTNTEMEIDFEANAEMQEQLKASGAQFPMIIKMDSKLPITMVTSKANANKEIPAVLNYGEISMTQTMNGEAMPQQPSAISNMKVKGVYKSGVNFEIEEVIGENVTEEIKQMLKTTMKTVVDNIHFPDKPLKIGESFTDNSPIQMPMAGFGMVKMDVATKYTLKSIQKNKALLDIDITLTLGSDQDLVNMQATGSGSGTGEYDIEQTYLTKYTSNMNMEMGMNMKEGVKAKVKMKSQMTNNVVIK